MSRFRFDQFSKQYLEELLGEARQIDVWFVPHPQPTANHPLGLLGQLSQTPCLLEPYRNPPQPSEIRDCLLKLFLIQAEFQR